MKTLYVDVYFLINFTVDVLALYFAALLCRVKIKAKRLILSGLIGALFSVFAVLFIYNEGIVLFLSLLFLAVMVFISSHGVRGTKRLRFGVSLLALQTLIGGGVYFSYTALDRLLDIKELEGLNRGNRRFLILGIIILFTMGFIKLLISFFSSIRAEKSVNMTIEYKSKALTLDAFVDSGNLACDPMDKTPVMLMKAPEAKRLFGDDYNRILHPENESIDVKRRVRIIPVSYGKRNILYALKPDLVFVNEKRKREEITLLVAIDEAPGSFSGYSALVPLSVLDL